MLNECWRDKRRLSWRGASLTAGDLSVRERQQRGVQRMLGVSKDGVPPVHLLHDFWVQAVLLRGRNKRKLTLYTQICACIETCAANGTLFHLNVSDELQSWSFYWGFAFYDSQYCSGPSHGFVQHLGVQAIRMLPSIHYDVPVSCRSTIRPAFTTYTVFAGV